MNKLQKLSIFIIFLSFVFISGISVLALDSELVDELDRQEAVYVGGAGLGNVLSVGEVIARLIQGFLSVLAVIFIILIIVAGYNWMSAGGDEQKVTKAKTSITRAVIGLIIIIGAYSITYFVFKWAPFGTTTPVF